MPPGVELVPLVDLEDRLRELHELAMAAHADDPADPHDSEQSFEDWLRDDLGVPDLDLRGSVVAVADGRLAALAFVASDGATRAENEFTGTHPDYRGRGLATLAKLSTLHWARSRGNPGDLDRQRLGEYPDAGDQPKARLPAGGRPAQACEATRLKVESLHML